MEAESKRGCYEGGFQTCLCFAPISSHKDIGREILPAIAPQFPIFLEPVRGKAFDHVGEFVRPLMICGNVQVARIDLSLSRSIEQIARLVDGVLHISAVAPYRVVCLAAVAAEDQRQKDSISIPIPRHELLAT